MKRRGLLALAGAALGAADWKEKDPHRLRAAAVAVARAGKARELAELGRQLASEEFLRRLDPAPGSVEGFGAVFTELAAHPSAATAEVCLRVAGVAGALPARWNFVLGALAAVRPMSAEAARVFVKTGREGFVEVNVPLLARNGSPRALGAMETLLMDEGVRRESRVEAARRGIYPNRLRPGVAESCERMLGGTIRWAVVECLFDSRPAEWFGKRTPYPSPPPWSEASAAVRAALTRVGKKARALPDLPERLGRVIDGVLGELAR